MLSTQFIVDVQLKRETVASFEEYPFCLDAVRTLTRLRLHESVTFIIGENGSGKSTLLEAIAIASGFNAEGGSKNFQFQTHQSHSGLHQHIRLSRGVVRPKDGYFLRAESFYNVASEIHRLDQQPGGPLIIDSYGGKSLHAQSHGESFMSLLLNRFRGEGLYILDEPEAALSPTRQLALLSRVHQLVTEGSQFLIATHSPIIMAYPNARIYQLGEEGAEEVDYEETEHYLITHDFISNRERMLRVLLEVEGGD